MKIVIAIDSFKGSMTSMEAGNAAGDGIKRVIPDADVFVKPIADGGEGTVDALVSGMNGKLKAVIVKNPIGDEIYASYGIIDKTAVIEMAAAAGIALISGEDLNPMNTTTYGVGEMIKDAIEAGCRNFIIGIGGSATNDGGVGMLSALGFEFLDKDGKNVPYGAKALKMIETIKDDNVIEALNECTFNIACDVKNPLCGKNGCSFVFAPQKGAKTEDLPVMDDAMEHYAKLTSEKYPDADKDSEGAGAAGGLGFAFLAYLNGKLVSGIDLILDAINIEESLKEADLVITGEGRLDSQTVMGKAPVGIAKLAKKYNKRVIAFAGALTRDAKVVNEHGIDAIFSIVNGACTLEEAMNNANAKNNMADTVEQVMRVIMSN